VGALGSEHVVATLADHRATGAEGPGRVIVAAPLGKKHIGADTTARGLVVPGGPGEQPVQLVERVRVADHESGVEGVRALGFGQRIDPPGHRSRRRRWGRLSAFPAPVAS
jgi:hypothetical protein